MWRHTELPHIRTRLGLPDESLLRNLDFSYIMGNTNLGKHPPLEVLDPPLPPNIYVYGVAICSCPRTYEVSQVVAWVAKLYDTIDRILDDHFKGYVDMRTENARKFDIAARPE